MFSGHRKNALDKAHAMVNHIAYPDELLMNSKLTEYYNTVIKGNNIFLEIT